MTCQAIETRYFGPTNHRGARIRAKAAAGVRWYSWDYQVDTEKNHCDAALKFAGEMEWFSSTISRVVVATGVLANGDYVHVLA